MPTYVKVDASEPEKAYTLGFTDGVQYMLKNILKWQKLEVGTALKEACFVWYPHGNSGYLTIRDETDYVNRIEGACFIPISTFRELNKPIMQ